MGAHHHDHDHHPHTHSMKDSLPRSLILAFTLTTGFMIVELLGGYLSNSLALVSDAFHMLTDAGALAVSLFSYWLAKRPVRPGFTYGYQRVEILGALLNGLTIWLVAGFLIFESYERFQAPQDVQGEMVMGIATVGLGINLFVAWILHRDSQHHLVIRAAYLHVLSDCLGSVGAMIAGAVIWLTNWRIIDPLITVLISLLMLWSSWKLIMEALGVLMEKVPTHLSEEIIKSALTEISGVTEVHHLHIWGLSSGKIALSVHLRTNQGGVLSQAQSLLSETYGISHTTIQVEGENDPLSDHCEDC